MYKENGDLSIKGMVFAVIIAVVVALCLDTFAYVVRSIYIQEQEPIGGVYGYMPVYTQKADEPIPNVNDLFAAESHQVDDYVYVTPLKKGRGI